MGVKEELEALRSQGVTKKNASKLKDANGLSTPEAEESALKAEHERNRMANYKKEAGENVKAYNDAKIAILGDDFYSPRAAPSPRTTMNSAETAVLSQDSNPKTTTSNADGSTTTEKSKKSSNDSSSTSSSEHEELSATILPDPSSDLTLSSKSTTSTARKATSNSSKSSEIRPQTPSCSTQSAIPSTSSPSEPSPLPTPADEPTGDPEETEENLIPKLQRFMRESLSSKAVVSTFVISVLLSFSLGLTVGIVPEVLSDRYARLYHGYGTSPDGQQASNNIDPLPPCWEYDTNTMPEACVMGADDAQTGSAYGMLFQNLSTFFFNAVLGSYSDTYGRRPLLLLSLFLNALVPAALVAMELIETMDPFWYYAVNAVTGFISYPSMVFAMISDNCPEDQRAGRFAMNMAGFYIGFAFAPMLPTYMSHICASWWSFALGAVVMVFSVLFLPETLPSLVQAIPQMTDEASPILLAPGNGIDNPSRERLSLRNGAISNEGELLPSGVLEVTKTILMRPFEEMAVLSSNGVLKLVAIGSFLSAAVYSIDSSLVLFYIEEHLNVREGDIAVMFLVMGILGILLQGFSLQPLVYALGEKGLLVLTFLSGSTHNFLYGVASTKTEITAALGLSQFTKLSYPLLSSLASQQVGLDQQGRVQGALVALNALAGALGPISMNWVYEKTKDGSHKPFGPGTMFLLSSGLYFLGAIVVSQISLQVKDTNSDSTANNWRSANETEDAWDGEDLEEPLLLRSGEIIRV